MRVFPHIQDMDIAIQIVWRKKIEDYAENPNKSYFENNVFVCYHTTHAYYLKVMNHLNTNDGGTKLFKFWQ